MRAFSTFSVRYVLTSSPGRRFGESEPTEKLHIDEFSQLGLDFRQLGPRHR